MKQQRLKTIVTVFVLFKLVLLFVIPTHVVAQACADPFEPDDSDPPWIGNGESQMRWFCPEGDVDKARFRIKAGHWYDVYTYDLGNQSSGETVPRSIRRMFSRSISHHHTERKEQYER